MFNYSAADYQPGTIIHHHPDFKYHQSPGTSSSQVKCLVGESPRHFHYRYGGEPTPRTESDAMLLGSAVHCLVLEPDQFDRRYQVAMDAAMYPDALKTVPQLKAWLLARDLVAAGNKYELTARVLKHDPKAPVWSVMQERQQNAKQKTVKSELMDKAKRMRDSVLSHPQAKALFTGGEPEVSVWGQHDDSGQLIKCRPDYLRADMCIDLKTCACSSPGAFSKDMAKFGYGLQEAHYLKTLDSAGLPCGIFVFVAVESEPPHVTQVYVLDEASSGAAVQRWHQAMNQLGQCYADDQWPAYTDRTELSLPGWYLRQWEQAA